MHGPVLYFPNLEGNWIINPSTIMESRRSFLKKSALTGLGASMISAQAASMDGPDPGKATLIITADLHAQLFTHDEFFWERDTAVFRKRGGLAVLKTLISRLRRKYPENILIDAGDYFHGHAIATLTEGQALVPLMNDFNYDLLVPGNWEVVYRKSGMLRDLGAIGAEKVCANMFHKGEQGDKGELIFRPWIIREIAGARIGIIGYTDHLTPRRQPPAFSNGIAFEHPNASLARHIRHLKEVEGCGIIVVVTHIGLAQQVALANHPSCAGADLVIGADTHERVREPIRCTHARVVECGAFGSFVGRLTMDITDGRMGEIDYELIDADPEQFPPDRAMERSVRAAALPFREQLGQVLGHTTTPLMRYFVLETPMDNLITDAIRWKYQPDIALSNGFRFCQPLAIPSSGKAAITREYLYNMLPLDSITREAWVTGRQLNEWLEKELENAFAPDPAKRFGGWFVRFSGMEVSFTIGNPAGKRVNSILIGKQPMDPDREYRVVACEREGDPADTLCRIEKVLRPLTLDKTTHQVMEEYLAVHSPVSPRLEGRAVATDQPATLLTQLQGTTYQFR